MTSIDYRRLSPQQRLDLIGEIWDSFDDAPTPLTPAQTAELDRRRTTLDEDARNAREADVVIAEFRARYG
ncbi:addiction module protein [Azospirillum sp. ST 5-10]|uniref:addiction module protein n=1 Tax=unclassified Azospirillum TaxID=2630922 RepID=UPI003F4A370C